MIDYLKGKCIKADKTFKLINYPVDGKLYSSSELYIPSIYKDYVYMVMHSDDTTVQLKSITSGEWDMCEIPLSMVEEFKIVNKESV